MIPRQLCHNRPEGIYCGPRYDKTLTGYISGWEHQEAWRYGANCLEPTPSAENGYRYYKHAPVVARLLV